MQGPKHKMLRVIDKDGAIHHWSCESCGLPAWFPEESGQAEKLSCSRNTVNTQLYGLKLVIKETRGHLKSSIRFIGLMCAAAVVAAIMKGLVF